MTDPIRWRALEGASPSGARELLLQARSRAMTAAEMSRSATKIASLAQLPAATGAVGALSGIVTAAGIGTGIVVVLIGVISLVSASSDKRSASHFNEGPDAITPQASAAPSSVAPPHPSEVSADNLPEQRGTGAAGSSAMASASAARTAPLRSFMTPTRKPTPKGASASPTRSEPQGDPAPGPVAHSLALEAPLILKAQALMKRKPDAALVLLEQHAREFPHGGLALEREVMITEVLHDLGRDGEARARGNAVLLDPRGSFFEDRVQHLVKAIP